jgi:hypothetical protein
MKKALIGMMLLLATGWGAGAQELSVVDSGAARETVNTASKFEETSAATVNLFGAGETRAFAMATAATVDAEAPAEPAAAAVPKPKFVFGSRDDYRWQLGVGVEFLRFRSDVINASMVGLNTTVTYYTNSWFGLEGNLVTGFAPEIYSQEHVKYFGGGGGIRIGSRRARWEPWGHALFGGGHLQPQTEGASRNALMIQAGAGVDYRIHARLSLRAEGDWVYTSFFHVNQNNFQVVAGAVLHF